jgi:hypothetical protein
MVSVKRVDDLLRSLKKPKIATLRNLAFREGDLLVLCAGFEDRAVHIIRKINKNKLRLEVLLINYLPFIKENKSKEIIKICKRLKLSFSEIVYDRENPAGAGQNINSVASRIKGRIFIDISAMSRLLIVQTLVALSNVDELFAKTNILYCEARNYPPAFKKVKSVLEKEDKTSIYNEIFLSSGVYGVTIVPELSSVSHQGQPTRLVAFPSFNTDQLAILKAEIQPFYLDLINGVPHLKKNNWRLEAIKKLNNVESIQKKIEYIASTLNYEETLKTLLDIYNKFGTLERIIVAPIGSKMQAVAVGLFKAFMNDIQIVYPTPRNFAIPKEYTVGVSETYKLSLMSFAKLKREK